MPAVTQTRGLSRFIEAQEASYRQALAELRAGRKQSHWMWFIFPQLAGLGHSSTSQYYALKSLDEAQAYLEDPLLGARLKECTETVLGLSGRSANDIFGSIDALKFRSSMTLFSRVSTADSPFRQALEKFFQGQLDERTLGLLDGG